MAIIINYILLTPHQSKLAHTSAIHHTSLSHTFSAAQLLFAYQLQSTTVNPNGRRECIICALCVRASYLKTNNSTLTDFLSLYVAYLPACNNGRWGWQRLAGRC